MNCQEYRDMIEDALDVSLHGELATHVRRHLEHCADCRDYFAARRAEHVALFANVNAAYSHLRPPPSDFVARLTCEVEAQRMVRRGWRRFALPRWVLIAASLVVMAGFVFAATTVVDRIVSGAPDSAGDGEMAVLGDSSLLSSPSHHLTTSTSHHLSVSTPEGERQMTRTKAAAAALTAAMAAAPLAAANGDEYQFIISGDPVAAATEGSSSDSSATAALMSGPLADGSVYGSELEARYRTSDESNTCSLRSDKAGLIISFK